MSTTPATSGRSSSPPFAFYDPDSSCWRTSQGTLDLGSMSSSVTLPKQGSMRNGALYPRRRPAPVIDANGSSLLRTPQAQVTEPKPGIKLANRTPSDPQVGLADQIVALLPTPMVPNGGRTMSGDEVRAKGKTPRGKRQVDLGSAVRVHLLPTPSANQYEMDDLDAYLERRERQKAMSRNGNGFGLVLAMAVKMLPTPTVGDSKAARNSTATRHRTPPTGIHKGDTLTDAIALLPTPTTSDSNGGGVHGDGGFDLRTTVANTYREGLEGREPAPGRVVPAWGDYEPAIRRWEHALGRPAPAPIDDKGRLNVAFVEWMQGFDAGWVEGLKRTAALRCLGNAVVQQQAVLALTMLRKDTGP